MDAAVPDDTAYDQLQLLCLRESGAATELLKAIPAGVWDNPHPIPTTKDIILQPLDVMNAKATAGPLMNTIRTVWVKSASMAPDSHR